MKGKIFYFFKSCVITGHNYKGHESVFNTTTKKLKKKMVYFFKSCVITGHNYKGHESVFNTTTKKIAKKQFLHTGFETNW